MAIAIRTGDLTGGEEFRRGWPTVLACLIGQMVGVHALPPYTIGFFIAPLQAEFGWSRTAISLGATVLTLAMAIGVPIAGSLINRLGEIRLIIFGMLALAAGYVALSLMGSSLPLFWTIMGLMAIVGAGCSPVTLSRALVSAFDRMRGTALGLTLIGTGLTGTLVPLLLAPIMAGHGWRAGYLTLACVMIVCMPVIVGLLWANRSAALPQGAAAARPAQETITIAALLREPPFARLLAAFFCIALAIGGCVVHFVPMLIDAGYVPALAARTASLLGLSLIGGRLLTGILIDRIFAPFIAVLLMSISAIGFVALSIGGPELLPYAALLVGLSFGSEIDLIVYLVSRYFPAALYGRIFGLLYAATMVGLAVSPVVYAQLHVATGHYNAAFVWAAAFLVVSAVLFATLPRFPGVAILRRPGQRPVGHSAPLDAALDS